MQIKVLVHARDSSVPMFTISLSEIYTVQSLKAYPMFDRSRNAKRSL